MNHLINLTGKTFGSRTVLRYAGYPKWEVRCKCGKVDRVMGRHIRDGTASPTCDDCRAPRYRDLTGLKFGTRIALRYAGLSHWIVRCKCGRIDKIPSSAILNGKAKRCAACHHRNRGFDWTGKTVGKYVVLRKVENGRWRVQCDCGNQRIAGLENLPRLTQCHKCGVNAKAQARNLRFVGKRFGKRIVLEGIYRRGRNRFRVKCDCGKIDIVAGGHLSAGTGMQCMKCARKLLIKHGRAPRSGWAGEYSSWSAMLRRCYGKKTQFYKIYGGRGITVCKEWHDFRNFFKDMGKRPKNKTLDRIDPDGNYCPSNCRWATALQQARNKRKK